MTKTEAKKGHSPKERYLAGDSLHTAISTEIKRVFVHPSVLFVGDYTNWLHAYKLTDAVELDIVINQTAAKNKVIPVFDGSLVGVQRHLRELIAVQLDADFSKNEHGLRFNDHGLERIFRVSSNMDNLSAGTHYDAVIVENRPEGAVLEQLMEHMSHKGFLYVEKGKIKKSHRRQHRLQEGIHNGGILYQYKRPKK